jgi:hypothetical protein
MNLLNGLMLNYMIPKQSRTKVLTCSDGERITRATFDRRIAQAKEQKLAEHFEKYGYFFCEDCKKNDCKPIDCSHDIPVSECIKSGTPELAYDVNNITLRGRKCHNKHDHKSKI